MNKKFNNKKSAFTLTEGTRRTGHATTNQNATPRPMHSVGFTLAEVLITLGVIGVVAAMTIPNLVANYQKKVIVNNLFKTYATLEEGFKRMLAQEDVSSLSYTEAFSNGVSPQGLRKYFKNVEDNGSIIMPNGVSVWPRYSGNDADGLSSEFIIELSKKSFILGRDMFFFKLLSNGNLVPWGSKKFGELVCSSDGWETEEDKSACIDDFYWRTSPDMQSFNCTDENIKINGAIFFVDSMGIPGCTARVFEEGKMNY